MGTATSEHRHFGVDQDDRPTLPLVRSHDASRLLPLAGRACLATIFLLSAPHLFSQEAIGAAAAQGVPLADVAVPLAGVFAAVGGLSVLFGYKAKTGALLLALFLVPVTLFMHRFWSAADPHVAQMQLENFLKNTGLLGGALMIAYFGAGPLSADARIARIHVRMLRDEDDVDRD